MRRGAKLDAKSRRTTRGPAHHAAVAAVVAALLAWASFAPAVAREFRVADSQPPGYPSVQALEAMAGLISERSGGRLVLRIYASAQLAPEVKAFDLSRAGVIDLVRINIATFNDVIPETRVLGLPFLFRDEGHLLRVLDGPIGAQILGAFQAHDLVGLAYFETSARSFYTVHGATRVPADFRGLRIRALPSALMDSTIEALGATPVYMPYGQVAAGLTTGLIDGAENNMLSYHEAGHYRMAPHFSETRHTLSPGVLVMPQRCWASLSETDRYLFRETARDAATDMRRRWRDRETAARAAMVAEGAEILDSVDRAAFVAAMEPVYARFAGDAALRELTDRIRATP